MCKQEEAMAEELRWLRGIVGNDHREEGTR